MRGRTRDILASVVGIGSGKQLEKAMLVFEYGSPELQDKVDKGEVSVHKAFCTVKQGLG